MCGIFQVVQQHTPIDRERFAAALQAIRHRGPDDTGIHYHDPLTTDSGTPVHIASGHQRLAILDLDQRARQPFSFDSHSLLFNGEIYNFRDLKSTGELAHVNYITSGDTEVLLHGLRLRGPDFLNQANGMWAISLLDQTRRQLFLSRDRYGKKPLFYYLDENTLCISSTIHAIHLYLGRTPQLRKDAVDHYLLYGNQFPGAQADTHFQGISQVPPGQNVTIDLNTWSSASTTYFDIDDAKTGDASPERLPQLLEDAVRLRLVSDRQVGLLLSGGIDSSLILSVIKACNLQDQVKCFIGETGKSPDAKYAAECIEKLGMQAEVVNLGYEGSTLDRFLNICAHHEKLFPLLGNSIAMAEMYERVSAYEVPVVLDGTGGDEFFGGYWNRYYPAGIRQALCEGQFNWVWQNTRQGMGTSRYLAAVLRETATCGLRFTDIKTKLKRTFPGVYRNAGLHHTNITCSADPLERTFWKYNDAIAADIRPGGRLHEWIWHNDRNAMLSGIENRSPLLDYRLAPYAHTGYQHKMLRGWNKHELREQFSNFVELPTQWRKEKQGFRWNRKAFLTENRDAILQLLDASPCLNEHYNIKSYVDYASKSRRNLVNSLTPRFLCIAGIEQHLNFDLTPT